MQIKLTEAIRHRSAERQAGDVLDLPDGEAHALVAAGLAEVVAEIAQPTTNPATLKRSK